MAWSSTPSAWGYTVWRRNIAAGETEATQQGQANPDTTQLVAEGLLHGDEYEFTVTAKNGGGSSAHSAGARATPFYTPPAAPTGLTATRNPTATSF